MRDREAFAAVALVWPIAVFIGALPFWLGGMFVGPFTDGAATADILRGAVNSWFESMSGFTTTGATVISHNMSPNCVPGSTADCINAQPRGLLIWRSLTQWFGGMGIIMLGMMILSRVIGGGMALARAELTGPSLSRLRPKLKQTAFALWGLYFFLTLFEFLLLYFTGAMNLFDAVNHSLTTMPSGGFSTHDASIGYYDSILVESIIICFMFLAGVNFTLLWFIREGDFKKAFGDEEFRNYVLYVFVAFVSVSIALALSGNSVSQGVRDGLFQVVSFATSTAAAVNSFRSTARDTSPDEPPPDRPSPAVTPVTSPCCPLIVNVPALSSYVVDIPVPATNSALTLSSTFSLKSLPSAAVCIRPELLITSVTPILSPFFT